jgi:hypothetical protein
MYLLMIYGSIIINDEWNGALAEVAVVDFMVLY